MSKDTLLLGTRKGLLMLTRRDGRWTVARELLPGVAVSHAMADPRSGTVWACADHGHWAQKLYRARDLEADLEEVPAPKYPDEAVVYDVWKDGAERPAVLSYLWTIAPGGADEPHTLYIGTEPGGVFRSDDDGASFHLIEGLWTHPSRKKHWFGGGRDQAGACSLLVDPRDSRRLVVGVSCGGVYASADRGETWEGRNRGLRAEFLPNPEEEYGHDPHCLAACAAHPDVLWQQNHCGVFRSTDGGGTWTSVSQPDGPVRFGFPIVADETDPDTAWVVPGTADDRRMAVGGALCVGRTEDGGRTWTALRNGLPQARCYDIVLRHAMDLSGDRIAFGSTTGNLFLSDDRGDTWQSLGYFFPPIYSVRFA
jgi:photosystem II stability/assembly factor-like uncharacterized protein